MSALDSSREIRITWRQWDRMIHHGWSVGAGIWMARGHVMLMRRAGREIFAVAVD